MVGLDTNETNNHIFHSAKMDGSHFQKFTETGSSGDYYGVEYPCNEDNLGKQAWCCTFFASKNESFQLKDNFRAIQEKLEFRFSRIKKVKQELKNATVSSSRIIVIAGINAPMSNSELALLHNYIAQGGHVIVLAEANAPIHYYNPIIAPFGITLRNDCVLRSTLHPTYMHPKECLVEDGFICKKLLHRFRPKNEENKLNILYTKGCSLRVDSRAAVLVTSGPGCSPANRPLAALYLAPRSQGKLVVVGSGHAFTQKYLFKEDNEKLLDLLLDILATEELGQLDPVDIAEADLSEYHFIPDTVRDSENVKACLQECDDFVIPGSVNMAGKLEGTRLIDDSLNHLSCNKLKELLSAYEELNVEKGPIRLIKPRLQAPLPPIKLAVFPPAFQDLPGPPLELFDIDDAFETEAQKLGRLSNRCKNDDAHYYLQCVAQIMRLPLPPEKKTDPKAILFSMFTDIAHFKFSKNNGYDDDSTVGNSSVESD